MIIKFGQVNSQMGSRIAGAAVRQKVVSAINRNHEVTFDFEGVENISNSFADECFAKLVDQLSFDRVKRMTVFKNASPFVKVSISNAFKERLARVEEF